MVWIVQTMRKDANPYIETFSGRNFEIYPQGEDKDALNQIHITDIAHALSMVCRYTGHAKRFMSVAEHSVLVSHLSPRENALEALLHDASEAYVADISSPFKPYLTNYRDIEKIIMSRIGKKFLLSEDFYQWTQVKMADLAALKVEAEVLVPSGGADWLFPENDTDFQNAVNKFLAMKQKGKIDIYCQSPLEAKNSFLERYLELTEEE